MAVFAIVSGMLVSSRRHFTFLESERTKSNVKEKKNLIHCSFVYCVNHTQKRVKTHCMFGSFCVTVIYKKKGEGMIKLNIEDNI